MQQLVEEAKVFEGKGYPGLADRMALVQIVSEGTKYSPQEIVDLAALANKTREAFPPSETDFYEEEELVWRIRRFAVDSGFAVEMDGSGIRCSRASGVQNCSCQFVVRLEEARKAGDGTELDDTKSYCRISHASIYHHTGGCVPVSIEDDTEHPPPAKRSKTNPETPKAPPYEYTPEQEEKLKVIAKEGRLRFPVGPTLYDRSEIDKEIRDWATSHNFVVATCAAYLRCSRAYDPNPKKKREGVQRRAPRVSARCGCAFAIHFGKGRDGRVRILGGTYYTHTSGCFPSEEQVESARRRSGALARSFTGSERLEAIADILEETGEISAKVLRRLMKPLYPEGHKFTSDQVRNCRRRAWKIVEDRQQKQNEESGSFLHPEDELLI